MAFGSLWSKLAMRLSTTQDPTRVQPSCQLIQPLIRLARLARTGDESEKVGSLAGWPPFRNAMQGMDMVWEHSPRYVLRRCRSSSRSADGTEIGRRYRDGDDYTCRRPRCGRGMYEQGLALCFNGFLRVRYCGWRCVR